MKKDEKIILLFDGVCNLCNSLVLFIIQRDNNCKFKFAALQSTQGQSLLQRFNLSLIDKNTFVLIYKDQYFIKSTAGLRVLKEIGGIWKLIYIFKFVPKPLRDFVYDLIAQSRYKFFGKRTSCMVPTDDIKNRFLE